MVSKFEFGLLVRRLSSCSVDVNDYVCQKASSSVQYHTYDYTILLHIKYDFKRLLSRLTTVLVGIQGVKSTTVAPTAGRLRLWRLGHLMCGVAKPKVRGHQLFFCSRHTSIVDSCALYVALLASQPAHLEAVHY